MPELISIDALPVEIIAGQLVAVLSSLQYVTGKWDHEGRGIVALTFTGRVLYDVHGGGFVRCIG